MFHNKSQEGSRLKRCSGSTGHFIFCLFFYCFVCIQPWRAVDFCLSLSCHGYILLPIPLVITTCTFKIALHCNTVIDSKSSKWEGDEKKATGLFWIVLQKPSSVFTGWEKGWAQGHGACSLLQRCLVCHLTLECCTVPVPPPPPLPSPPPPLPPPSFPSPSSHWNYLTKRRCFDFKGPDLFNSNSLQCEMVEAGIFSDGWRL